MKSDLASRLDRRITLQQAVETPDGGGGFTTAWNSVATVWAEVKPAGNTRALERSGDGKLEETHSFIVTIRYRAGMTAGMRISYGGRLLNIRGVINPDEGRGSLELLAEEGVAQ